MVSNCKKAGNLIYNHKFDRHEAGQCRQWVDRQNY
jgi:hypothetical protein